MGQPLGSRRGEMSVDVAPVEFRRITLPREDDATPKRKHTELAE